MHGGREWRLGFAGFGHVNRALLRLLVERRRELAARHGLRFKVTLVSGARRGALVDRRGIDAGRLLRSGGPSWSSRVGLIEALPAAPIDLLFEGTPLDPMRGEPATTHARLALRRGVSVVSANKGPVAFGARPLRALAQRHGAGFRFEAAVADCLPVFNLYETALPVGRVLGARGVLNSTSNHVLQAVADGREPGRAVADMVRRGIAEADPSHDLDGWDQAVKIAILAQILLGRRLRPADVVRIPFSQVDRRWLRRETRRGRRVHFVASVAQRGPARVAPVALEPGTFLATLSGTSLGLSLETELAGRLNVSIDDPDVRQTAYAMLSDLIAIHHGRRLLPETTMRHAPARPRRAPGRGKPRARRRS